MAVRASRDEFIEQGFVILRQVIPPGQLEDLRRAHELLVDRQRAVWARDRGPDDPPGGEWETNDQPRLAIHDMGAELDRETASAIEVWLHENFQGVSSHLLAEEDVPPTAMALICNPARDHGPGPWHRDFYPPLTAPLQAYIDDIIETGPRYVQWNLALYDDDVLCVIPGSHIRRGTEEEHQTIGRNSRAPVRGAVQTQLRAGDGLAYILPILHWGIDYSPKLRRTIHGGFARLTQWDDVSWLKYLSPAAQDTFSRWHQRSATYVDQAEAALRAVLHKNPEAYHAALEALQPGRGDKGVLKSTICLSKTANYIYNQRCRDFDSLSAFEQRCVHIVQPATLQWGLPLGERFEAAEARVLWERFKPIDDILQTEEEHTVPGFQGADTPTRYLFEDIPAELSVENWMASWESGRLGD